MADDRSGECIETTLVELLTTISEVSETEAEAFAVLESLAAQGRIQILGAALPATAVRPAPAPSDEGPEAATVAASRPVRNHARSA